MIETLPSEWREKLHRALSSNGFKQLESFIKDEDAHMNIFPPLDERFTAFRETAFKDVKVVILGQDPYHGAGQAHGLAFSVKEAVKLPPSLLNIYKELADNIGCEMPKSGNLSAWAKEGVFLLNTVLTVREASAGSHQKQGWEAFTDAAITSLSEDREHLVFILWGKPAQCKEKLIDSSKHLVLKAPHPSPLSSYRGFFGSKPFSKANAYLRTHGVKPIQWCLQ